MAVTKWTFYDATGPTTYTFAVNPKDGGSPTRRKNIQYKNTSAPDGKTLIFEGRDEPGVLSFSGVILQQAELEAFETWFDKRRQIRITDDLGRQYWVYITSFEPKRERAIHYPYKHSYTIEATILDWPS